METQMLGSPLEFLIQCFCIPNNSEVLLLVVVVQETHL